LIEDVYLDGRKVKKTSAFLGIMPSLDVTQDYRIDNDMGLTIRDHINFHKINPDSLNLL